MPYAGALCGRSSDLQAAYLLQLPSSMAEPVLMSERSFLLTAAGQFRILTGFPFKPDPTIRHRKVNRFYMPWEGRGTGKVLNSCKARLDVRNMSLSGCSCCFGDP